MLASKGKRVILLDADPQCHLTEMFLSFSAQPELEELYHKNQNIKAGLAPVFEAQPRLIRTVDCISAEGQERLYLLPGHVGLAEYEATLARAKELSASLETLKNLPGAITYLLNQTAQKYSAGYILIDMSPSLGAITLSLPNYSVTQRRASPKRGSSALGGSVFGRSRQMTGAGWRNLSWINFLRRGGRAALGSGLIFQTVKEKQNRPWTVSFRRLRCQNSDSQDQRRENVK
jgi:hypothetical protein